MAGRRNIPPRANTGSFAFTPAARISTSRRGEHTYVFRYRTGRQVRWFDGKPELNWNVTGNFWRFPIFQANYNLELADGARPLRWTAYTGRLGARGGNWRATIDTSGALMVATTRPLAPGEGLTVVAELPSGAVDPPASCSCCGTGFMTTAPGFSPASACLSCLATISSRGEWSDATPRAARHPLVSSAAEYFASTCQLHPRLGFRPREWRAFTAAALSLAVRELLRFDHSSGTLALKATGKKAPGRLPVGERSVLDWVNGQGGLAIISDAHGASIAKVGDSFTKSIERENRNRFFRRNLGYVIAGLAMTAAAIGGVLVFGGLQDQDLAVLGGLCIFRFYKWDVPGSPAADVFCRREPQWIDPGSHVDRFSDYFHFHRKLAVEGVVPKRTCRFASRSLGLCRALSILLRVGRRVCNGEWPVLVSAARADRARPTDHGSARRLRLYLQTAESDRLNLNAPEITAERFEALLPYAVALDVEKPWSMPLPLR